MTRYLSRTVTASLVLLLSIVSAGLVYTTLDNIETIEMLSVHSLQNTALALSTAAESALRESRSHAGIGQMVSDRVIAYAFLSDTEGKVLFHTNDSLIGSMLPFPLIREALQHKSGGHRIRLGTGTPAYQFHQVIHPGTGAEEVLWLVLYTTQADRVVAGAKRMWWSVGFLLLLMWAGGFFTRYLLVRYLAAREKLEHAGRMAMIGRMTAVLAHEIRNALGGVKGYVQWMDEKAGDPGAVREGAAMVVKGAERIEGIVGDLLLFSKEEVYNIIDFDLRLLVSDTVPLALSGWKGTVRVEPGDSWGLMKGDREKVQRVLVNALQNGAQAMGDRGTLSISFRRESGKTSLIVADSGPGIGDDDLARLFTPFFTTKVNGTGLGLAYSKKVIEAMGGTVSLENGDAGGAVFTITLKNGKG